LQVKLAGHSHLPVHSNDEKVLAIVRETAQRAEREFEGMFVDRLRAGVAANEAAGRTNGNSIGAVAGIDKTLEAVYEKRVETLLVSDGFVTEGWRCHDCSYIATLGRMCKKCGSEMELVDDVVEEAVEDALGQSCRVEFCSENADLDVLGRIGALLRF
jgi:peptide subunit release factor 1 (eRF1)